ncbi:MAG: tyramine oxidase subunit B [Thermodesulfobacteriota bacterium]|nr:tyramine oxidase subunit B [Thermodesulfobacteriota bacterium]
MQKKIEFLFLAQEDMIQAGVLDMRHCLDVMDRTFKLMAKGDYVMGGPSQNHHGIKLWFPKEPRGPGMPVAGPDRRFMSMVSYLGGEYHVCGSKWYGSNVENPVKHGLPRSVLLLLLNDPETGVPLAVMDGNLVSAMRTGAVIGLGARYLARTNASVAGIIACGVISKTSLMALAAGVKHLREVKVFDIDPSKAVFFSEEMSQSLGLNIYPVGSMEEAIRGSDVVCTATSRVKRPYFEGRWFKDGVLFELSADADLSDDLWLSSRVVADNWRMHMDWREEMDKAPQELKGRVIYSTLHDQIIAGRMKDSDIIEMGRIVSGDMLERERENQKIILVTGGLGIEDVSWGHTIYKQALEKGLGQKLKLWEEPYWF